MNAPEFKYWLEGYIEGGGNDAGVIAEKARQIVEPVHWSPPAEPWVWRDHYYEIQVGPIDAPATVPFFTTSLDATPN